MRGLRAWRWAALAPLVSGCAVQAGAGVGSTINHQHVTHGSHLSAAVALRGHSPHIGAEVSSQFEQERGSAVNVGLQGGYAYAPPPGQCNVGFIGHVDWGFPVDAEVAGGYVGTTVNLPISLASPHSVLDRNENYHWVARRIELLPYARYRAFYNWEGAPGDDASWRHDVQGGVAARLRLASDLF